MKYKYSGILQELVDKALTGSKDDVDFILSHLTSDSNLVMTRFVDFALGLVKNPEGIEQIKYYLFNGPLIQRNYASLYFNRRGDWEIVMDAFRKGCIDETQAFAR